jgi:glycosyltransferase involved in cell wall biosynthesis
MKYKKISIVIPCYNESKTIEELLAKVEKAEVCGMEREIIVVDDGSKDGTRDILDKYKKKSNYQIIFHKQNKGKGGALKTGFSKSTGDIVLIQDADLEYDPDEYPILLEPIIKNKADVVYGSRFMGGRPHRVVYYWHSVMNNFLTTFSNMLTNINLTDMETCYKVFKGEIIREIEPKLVSNRFGFEPEVTAKLSKIKGIRFYEVGISYYGRTYEEGKHINWKDGCRAIWEIIKYNLFK